MMLRVLPRSGESQGTMTTLNCPGGGGWGELWTEGCGGDGLF